MTESLNYLLLGNLHVVSMSHWHGGLPPKTRMLLALLLTAGPEGVSTRRIVAGLWGDDFPLSAPQMIRTHVMRLRSMLGPHGAVHRTRGGYRIEAARSELDSAAFEDLLDAARTAGAAGDPARAAGLLRRAIGLWRGDTALADVREVLELEAEAVRLEELRLYAEELLADCLLVQGRTDEVLPGLLALCVRHPLRERLRARLMLALAAAGRRAEAGQVYLRSRAALREQAGLEPSAQLSRVHRSLLGGDAWESAMGFVSPLPASHPVDTSRY
ncbi:BTAD domain-containing putative transcriptional regulator [Streptomyces sp. NPDC056653]|uniref:AfsR/SARP family transcriptional regulator n=1 Tax=Streptomyces sp. NPDC056653 TaxID=3345894 RepID=UPI0036B31BE1